VFKQDHQGATVGRKKKDGRATLLGVEKVAAKGALPALRERNRRQAKNGNRPWAIKKKKKSTMPRASREREKDLSPVGSSKGNARH